MKLEINIRPAAEADIVQAYEWYEAQRKGLGQEFMGAVDDAFKRIVDGPDRYQTVLRDARRILLRAFP